MIRSFYRQNPSFIEQNPEAVLKTLMFATSKEDFVESERQKIKGISNDQSSEDS